MIDEQAGPAKRRVYGSVLSRASYLPLVWGCLRTYCETQDDLAAAYDFQEPFFLAEQVATAVDDMVSPAVFAASCYLWNFRKQMRLCAEVKERFPDVVTVVGGPHVPDLAANFLTEHPYVDFAIHKEGEVPFASLLRELLAPEPDFTSVPSLSWIDAAGQFRHTPLGGQLPRDIDVPSPWLSGTMDAAIETARRANHPAIALWETNRGCPYSCTFCDWGSNTMSKVRKYDEDRLHEEIDYFARKQIAALMCCDANFGILPRDVKLAQHIVQSRAEAGYPSKFVTSYAKNAADRVFEISRMFVEAGLSRGTILAMQSGTPEVLEAVRRSNMPAERYEQLAERFQDAGVQTYTEVILGLPSETPDSFIKGLCRMLDMGIHDDIMIYECAVLPNSELGTPLSRAKWELDTIVRRYLPDDIETIEVVVQHTSMSRADWVGMYLFGATVQSLHNRSLTNFIARYLNREKLLCYEDFYRSVRGAALADTEAGTVFGKALNRVKQLLERYQTDPSVPNEGMVLSQPDMAGLVRAWVPGKESWLPYEYCWGCVQNDLDRFYTELRLDLVAAGVGWDERLEDVFRFQRMSVFTVRDERDTRVELLGYNWAEYFEGEPLAAVPTVIRFDAPRERMT